MNMELLKVGEVVEVRGQKVRVGIYSEKNSSYLTYEGTIIKNVSVGGFVKVRKGFSDIIARVEGEYIKEKKDVNAYSQNQDSIERIIELSIVGTLKANGTFERGLNELPLVSNFVYILTTFEIQRVFAFIDKNEPYINIGKISNYEEFQLDISVQNLFASHIGIFGNTGSGKSNTLAKIYNELFNKYDRFNNFQEKSKFIFIDFNGEYSNSISNKNKIVYNLSTQKLNDSYPILKEYLLDLEFWSIILEATEKTQQPFLRRSLSLFKTMAKDPINISIIIRDLRAIIHEIDDYKDKFSVLNKYYVELLGLAFDNIDEQIKGVFNRIAYHTKNSVLYFPDSSYYCNNKDDFLNKREVIDLINSLIEANFRLDTLEGDQYWDLFEYCLKLQYLKDIRRGYIIEEHVAPVLRRLDTRIKDLKKVFVISEKFQENEPLEIISLIDVNIYMRKIIPMLICKMQYALQKSNRNQKVLYIIVDEAHNILSKNSERESSIWKDYRLEIFEEIIKEGRKFGTFLTISSQRPSDIAETLISQLHNYFLHRLVNNEDIRAIGKTVSFLDNVSFEMLPVLPQGGCIFTGTASNFPIIIQVDMVEEHYRPKSDTIKLDMLWKD